MATWQDPSGRLMEARAHRLVQAQRRAEPGEYEKHFPFKTQPWQDKQGRSFQMSIFAAARQMPFFALAPVVMGAGKSWLMIQIATDKFFRNEIDCVAIVSSPKGVHRQWIDTAIPTHISSACKWRGQVWKAGRKVDPRVAKPEANRRLRFLSFNVEAFSTESGRAAMDLLAFMKSGRCFLIFDESSRGKTPGAKRTKTLLKLAPHAACRAIASGTPITRGLEDLWAQYEFLSPSIIGMSNYYAFRARYCVTMPAYRGAGLGQIKIIGYRNMEEFVRKIAPVTFVVPKEALGLPKKRKEELPVEPTREQKMLYNALRNKLIDDLAQHRIATPANGAVRLIRLQQVLCGRVYEDSQNEEEPPICRTIPSSRIATLIECIQDRFADVPLTIWARFTADIEEIAAALRKIGRRPVTYYGATTDEAREKAKKDFVGGKATDFVSNPSVGGMGVDGLQEVCETQIYYSSSFNREHRWQSEDRIDRIGKMDMEKPSLYIDLVVPNSVDRMILQSYEKTETLVASVMSRPELLPVLAED